MSNIAYTSFNTMLQEFVSNLADVFDDNAGLKAASNTLSGFLELDPNTSVPLEKFHDTFAEHAPLVMAKDKSLFKKVSLPFIDDFDVIQAFEESDDETAESIWAYMNQLTMLALTSKNMTPDMMSSVQSITDSYMKKVRSGEISEEDAANPMRIMMELQDNPELKKIMDENS